MSNNPCRILIADDLPAIHDDYRRIFASHADAPPKPASAAKFASTDTANPFTSRDAFELTYVNQGEEAVAAADTAAAEGRPFALAFLDVRMPPGIDGIETARRLIVANHGIQIVLCTAYSDYNADDLARIFPKTDSILLLQKPFEPIEVRQCAHALHQKWRQATESQSLIKGLSSRVAERTAQLIKTAEELAAALHLAQSAERAKHEFLRCVSHELNTPLNGVQGAASILALSSDPQTRELGAIIHKTSAHLHRLFVRILLFLDLEAEAARSPEALAPANLLAGVLGPHQAAAAAKHLQVQSHCLTPPSLQIKGPAKLLFTALDNLVENAIKFTPSGEVRVMILHTPADSSLLIEVSDTGLGLTQKKIDDLTAPFSPGDVSNTRSQDGIGIGLALVGRIAQCLGGTLQARRGATSGSIFTLTIPCTDVL